MENPESSPIPVAPTPRSADHWRWLSNQNPFYLLSAACVMHGTGWRHGGEHDLPPWLSPLLIAGYIALLAMAGGAIVRLWKVWDDARSIFVTLLILFLELAMSLDQFALRSPAWGTLAILAGWMFAACVSETLLLGLRMRLPRHYRCSFHLQMGLLFGYPLLLIPAAQRADNEAITAGLLAFAVVIALPLLLLWPAVRRGPAALVPNGTPWSWPMYPWTLPTVLSGVLIARSYSLCLTFDSVPGLSAAQAYDQLASIFGGYFAVPTILAAGLLILESGIISGRRLWQLVGLAMPGIALALSSSWTGRNAAADAVLSRLTGAVGSPLWITLGLAAAFFLLASLRGVRFAPRLLVLTLALGLLSRPQTMSWLELPPPPTWLWLAAAASTITLSIWRRQSRFALEGNVYLTVAIWQTGWLARGAIGQGPAIAMLFLLLLTVIAIVWNDEFAKSLRDVCHGIIVLASLWLAASSLLPRETWWLTPAALACLAGLATAIWWFRQRADGPWTIALVVLLWYGSSFIQGAYALNDHYRWGGLPTFAVGLGLLHVGFAISAVKGLARRASSA